MSRFKRYLSTFIALIIAVSSQTGIYASANEADGVISDMTAEAMEVLKVLSVIQDYSDYNVNLGESVSRADFAETLAKLIGCDKYVGDEVFYYDVPKSHYAFGSISYLTQIGVTGGTADRIFSPDDAVETNQALKMAVSVLGYRARAEVEGGYPTGYVNMAKKLGITDGLSLKHELSREDMFLMMYRALNVRLFVTASVSTDNGVEYKVSENDTLLSVYHDAALYKGTVQGAMMISLCDIKLKNRDEVIIDGKLYKTDTDISDMLGERVKVLLQDIDGDDNDKTVIWARRVDTADTVTVDGDDADGFDDNTYTLRFYGKNVSRRTAKIERDAVFIYNGRELGEKISDTLNSDFDSVKLIRDSGGLYRTVIIKNSINFVAESGGGTQKVIFDKAQKGRSLKVDTEEYDFIIFRNSAGEEISADSIKTDDVLSVFMSKDGLYADIIVSSRIINGTVDSIKNSGTERTAKLGDSVYRFCNDADSSDIKAGSGVRLYLDYRGRIAYAETVNAKKFAAFVYKYSYKDDGFDKPLRFKMFAEDGEVKLLKCADTVRLDGAPEKNPERIIERFMSAGIFTPQLALIELNGNGEIKLIDTANEGYTTKDDGNVLAISIKNETLWYKNGGYFADRGMINNESVIFAVPDDFDSARDTDFAILGMKDFSNDSWPTIETYSAEERSGYEKYVVARYKGRDHAQFPTTGLPVIVEDFGMMMNSDGSLVEYISGHQGESVVSFMADESYSFAGAGVKKGMVVRPKIDGYGNTTEVTVCFDPDYAPNFKDAAAGIEKNTNINTFGNAWRFEAGYVNDIVDSIVKIGFKNADEIDHKVAAGKAAVLIYDAAKEEARVGTLADARTYYNSGANCSRVVMISNYCVPQMFVIYD